MITASIVLYETPEGQLTRLLESLKCSNVSVHLYIIDNSPVPTTGLLLDHSSMTYIRSERNLGYGGGHNLALRRILESSEFHFVLNPDIHFCPEELDKMIRFMREHSDIGQLMPKVTDSDGRVQYLCKLIPAPADLFARRFATASLRVLLRGWMERYELRFTGYNRVMDVPQLSGCFMLFRVAALREIGLFDERFMMYLEDFDICRRMNARFRTVFFPGAAVVHDHARASYTSFRSLRMHVASSIKYFNKWGWFRDAARSKINRETLRRLSAQ